MNSPETASKKHQRYRIGDLVLDTGRSSVTRQGDEVALPRLSFDLLFCLARHAPNVVDTDTLMDEVWGRVVVNEETVKQRIKLLRKSLGDDSRNPKYIGAIRGRGYRLVAEVSEADDDAKQQPSGGGRWSVPLWIGPGLLILTLLIGGLYLANRENAPPDPISAVATQDIQRVAVLPFVNIGNEAADDYLADGITEEIITALAQLTDLGIIARTSVMRYKNSDMGIARIAKLLDVGTVLEGSVQRFDDQLRITVQMIDATTEEHYWAQTYPVHLEELQAMQVSVAEQVANSLQATISGERRQIFERGSAMVPEAYDLYLKGRDAYRRWTPQDNEAALSFYQQAIDLDPEFVLAIAGRANALALKVAQFGSGEEWLDEAEKLALRALAINPNLAEAHKARGIIHFHQGRYQRSMDDYRQALLLMPNYDEAAYNAAEISQLTGRWDEAVRYQLLDRFRPFGLERLTIYLRDLNLDETANELADGLEKEIPVSLPRDANLSLHFLLDGQPEAARTHARRMQSNFPHLSDGYVREAEIDIRSGLMVQAREKLEKALNMTGPQQNYIKVRLAEILLPEQDDLRAQEMLDEVESASLDSIERGHEGWFHRWNLAMIYSLRGNTEAALNWYERAVDAGRRRHEWDSTESAFAAIADEPGFRSALERQRTSRDEMKKTAADLLKFTGLESSSPD